MLLMANSQQSKRWVALTDDKVGALGDPELGDEVAIAANNRLAKGDNAVDSSGANDLRERRVKAEKLANELVKVRESVELLTDRQHSSYQYTHGEGWSSVTDMSSSRRRA